MFTPLFTDGVWNTTFVIDLKDYCSFIRKTNKGRILSNSGGFQSTDLNLSDYQLQPLINHIQSEASFFSQVYNIKNSSFVMDNMWININGYKDYNIPHTHTQCVFSGVYYVQSPKDCGVLSFNRGYKPVMGYDWNLNVTSFNSHNAVSWFLPCEKHKCYIFPSYLEHCVEPNLNKEEERISISFNLVQS